jgi:class 3 adenylate cyclase
MAGQASRTLGFLFADLRGYSAFVEAHGDDVGAQLLRAYRDLVRCRCRLGTSGPPSTA